MPELLNKISDIKRREKEIDGKISKIEAQIKTINSKKRDYTGEIKVIISCTEYVKLDFKLKYFVYNAGWVPNYGIRSGNNGKEVQLDYDADVRQNSGEDWNDVHLTLCSGNPTLGGTAPELNTWFISFNKPIVSDNLYKDYEQSENQKYATGSMQNSGDVSADQNGSTNHLSFKGNKPTANLIMVDGVITSNYPDGNSNYKPNIEYGSTTASQNQINVCFDINLNENVLSDNIARHVRIQQSSLPAAFTYKAIPKLDKDAFLVAQVTGWDGLNLLPGDASVFMDGSFVGKTYLNTTVTTDTLDLSFGRDKRINIKCTKLKDFSKKQFLSGTVKQTFRKSIYIRNTKNTPIDIIVEEQIPISTDKAIEVVLDESSKADYDVTKGKLTWKLTLKPNENLDLPFQYTVKYPKGRTVYGLY
jgi:hypothetical protein